ncbi:hypothetical protein HYFRA_00011890 [Hymenoscyphus fraxineus]|uniref:F-box domain-containing protein n=1 Tax=Hymenoscyphus fraxineus TaxID=746836 RepID=A0A9N9PUE1_9HELO|nr:hypothetical protein HYFRA_00011890 [Hymenoscyphus fraxineus]
MTDSAPSAERAQPHATDLKDPDCWKMFGEGIAPIFTIPVEAHVVIFNNLHLLDAVSLSLTCTYLYALSPTRFIAIRRARHYINTRSANDAPIIPLNLGAPDSAFPLVKGCTLCLPALYYPCHCELHFHIEKFMPAHLKYCNSCRMFTLNYEESQRRLRLERRNGNQRLSRPAGRGVLFNWVPELYYDEHDEQPSAVPTPGPDHDVQMEEIEDEEESLASTASPSFIQPGAEPGPDSQVQERDEEGSLPSTVSAYSENEILRLEIRRLREQVRNRDRHIDRLDDFVNILRQPVHQRLISNLPLNNPQQEFTVVHSGIQLPPIPGNPPVNPNTLREIDINEDGTAFRGLQGQRLPRLNIEFPFLAVNPEPEQWNTSLHGSSRWIRILEDTNPRRGDELCGRCNIPYSLANDCGRQHIVPRQPGQRDRVRRWYNESRSNQYGRTVYESEGSTTDGDSYNMM